MIHDRSPIWIGIADLLLCCLSVILMAVAPSKAKTDGIKPTAEYLITMTYPVDRDEDIDLWVVPPERRPVFYDSRQVGCTDLDRDSLGYSTSTIVLADGSTARAPANIETTSIRCKDAGHFDVAVVYYSDHGHHDGPMPVHVEVTGLNPNVRTVWAGDVRLDHVGQVINAVSFELDRDASVKIVPTPLESATNAYLRARPSSAP